MLHFFRRIRKALITDSKYRKYLMYALGEIALVMIGILLALQVNNWNEERKILGQEKTYLIGIKNDLSQDTAFLTDVIKKHSYWMERIIYQDPTLNHSYTDSYLTANLSFSHLVGRPVPEVRQVFTTERRFRPKQGSYNSLISEGKSGIITNRLLFDEIQRVYHLDYKSSEEIAQKLWERSNELINKFSYDIRYGNYGDPIKIDDKKMIGDLYSLYGILSFYTSFSINLKKEVTALIDEVEMELKLSLIHI